MKYIDYEQGDVVSHEDTFEKPFGQHGKFKVGFGESKDSADNATAVCGTFNSGNMLREEVAFSSGDSSMGATMGGDRDLVVSSKPFDENGYTSGHIVGTLAYRNGSQPTSSRLSMFVSETGAPDEDPKPLKVQDGSQPGEYEVNRNTGLAANRDYYWRMFRHNVNDGQEYPALTVEASAVTPETDTIYPEATDILVTVDGIDYWLIPA